MYTLALVILRKQDAFFRMSAISFTNVHSVVPLCHTTNASKTGLGLQVKMW